MRIVKTKTSDNLFLHGLLSTPQKESKRIIIHVPGLAGGILDAEYYQAMHDKYPSHGIAFLAAENRGSGMITSFGDKIVGCALQRFEDCPLDLQAWVDFAIDQGFEDIWLQGHSLGPSKIAYYIASSKPENISGLIFLSPSEMIGLVHDEEGIKDHEIMFPEAKKLVADGKADELLAHKLWGVCYLSAGTYLNLFGDGAKTAIFNYADDSLGWDVVNSLSLPVLALTGTKDDGITPVMDPYKAMEKLKKELVNSPRVRTVVFEGAEHGFEGFADNIIQEVLDFI